MEALTKYRPIEVTTHNIYFHEESPILSTDFHGGVMATAGYDNTIRFWTVNFKEMKYKDSVYRTAANSSVSIALFAELNGFSRPINCVRFYKGSVFSSVDACVLAACSDGGKVLVFSGSRCATVRSEDGDDAYEVSWAGESLVVGFASGRIEVYKASISEDIVAEGVGRGIGTKSILDKAGTDREEPRSLRFILCTDQKIHDGAIQGISIDKGLVATHSIDRSVKIHLMSENMLILVSVLDKKIDCSRGLFKRILLVENLLYVFTKGNMVNVYAYPFREIHLHKKIGPLNSSAVKIVKNGALVAICTKKSVYVLENDNVVCCVDNSCYMAITDGFMLDGTLFLSSMDGFMATVRLSSQSALG